MESKLVRFNKGDVIFAAGDTSREMYIIRTGTVKVMINKDDSLLPLTELGAGHYIGEMAFLTGVPRSATVFAESPVLANLVNPDVLSDENLGLANWAVSIAGVLVRRIRNTTKILGNYIADNKINYSKESPETINIIEFEIECDNEEKPERVFLKGSLTDEAADVLKTKLRELRLKNPHSLILDFSHIIDIDQNGINLLLDIAASSDIVKIDNIQLIRDKVLSIKGIQDILAASNIPLKKISKGDYLIRQGEIETDMYVVKSGLFSITRESLGNKIFLDDAGRGDVIGEMALINQAPRSADVKALKDSSVYVVNIREFYNNIYNIPGWFMDLIKGLVERLRTTDEMLDHYVTGINLKEENKRWPDPFCILMDSTKPSEFMLKGNLKYAFLPYLKDIIKTEVSKGCVEIVLNLSGIKQIDHESIKSILIIYRQLEKKGIRLVLRGPQKFILELFRQYRIKE